MAAVTYIFMFLFVFMASYVIWFLMGDTDKILNNPQNKRQELLAERIQKGSILSDKGKVLAKTETDSKGNEKRVYPYNELFAHVVGRVSHGKTGLEASEGYTMLTTGINPLTGLFNELKGEKNPGNNVVTTLNVKLSQIASESLGSRRGAVVVTEPSTGKILALVSKPSFDPNQLDRNWESLIRDNDDDSALYNRATQGLYPPGSTFKIVTALEYIRENPDSYGQYSYQCNGRYSSGQDTINCYHGSVHGHEDFTRSFAKSCNASFANIGMTLDRTRWGQTLDGLLFNQELPVSFAYNKSKLVVNADTSDSDILQASIGQGTTQITPLHLNMITCAIANGGTVMKPYLVDHVKNNEGTVIKQFSPDSYKELLTQTEAAVLTELMTAVVESGTGTKLAGLTYTAAGKTGSAEFNNVKTDSHAWFTGFAPAQEPEVCVTIIIEGAGSGGDYAVPIAKRIFDEYFGV